MMNDICVIYRVYMLSDKQIAERLGWLLAVMDKSKLYDYLDPYDINQGYNSLFVRQGVAHKSQVEDWKMFLSTYSLDAKIHIMRVANEIWRTIDASLK